MKSLTNFTISYLIYFVKYDILCLKIERRGL
nr:MAG TPA: hypothetical protein [Caudoviricetes sp.]